MKILKVGGKDPTIEISCGNDDKCDEKKKQSKQIQIFIHKDNYDEKGISKDIVCGVNKDMKIVPKYLSYSDILFHELNHALHHMEDVYYNRFRQYNYSTVLGEDLPNYTEHWTNDEELYNITGYISRGVFDPINCNMFDIYNCCKRSIPVENIIQRVRHSRYAESMKGKTFKTTELLTNISSYMLTKN
jgi:hypothetical protein